MALGQLSVAENEDVNVRQKTAGLSCKMQLRARQRDSQGAAGFGSWQQILSPNIASGLNSTQDVQLGGSNFVMRYSYIYIVRLWEEEKQTGLFIFGGQIILRSLCLPFLSSLVALGWLGNEKSLPQKSRITNIIGG